MYSERQTRRAKANLSGIACKLAQVPKSKFDFPGASRAMAAVIAADAARHSQVTTLRPLPHSHSLPRSPGGVSPGKPKSTGGRVYLQARGLMALSSRLHAREFRARFGMVSLFLFGGNAGR